MTRFRWKWHATPYCLRDVTTTSPTLRGATTAPSTRHPRHAMTRNDTRQKRKKHQTTAIKLFVRISTLEALEYRNHRYGVPNAVVMVCSGNLVGVTNKQNQITSCLIFFTARELAYSAKFTIWWSCCHLMSSNYPQAKHNNQVCTSTRLKSDHRGSQRILEPIVWYQTWDSKIYNTWYWPKEIVDWHV